MLGKEEKRELIGQFKAHEADTGSPEVQVAILTEKISRLTEHLPWLPWVGIGAAALVVIVLLIMTARMPAGGVTAPKG